MPLEVILQRTMSSVKVIDRRNQLCPPCVTPSSNSSLDYRRSDVRIVENGFATSGGVSKSAKVVLAHVPEKWTPVFRKEHAPLKKK